MTVEENLRFAGRVAIVTGAAHGIGRAIAQRLSDEGANVVIFDLEKEAAEETAGLLPGSIAFEVDVTDERAIQSAVEETARRFGSIDILVNNAGGALMPPQPFWEMTKENWTRVTEVNAMSQWLCSKAVLPYIRERGSGSIVNMASGSAIHSVSGMAAYGAAKAAVASLTRTMAKELGEFEIRVNAIAPGYIHFTRPKAVFTAEQVEQMERNVIESQSLQRIGQPEDIAAAVAFFCSDDALHVTGQTLMIDGGGK